MTSRRRLIEKFSMATLASLLAICVVEARGDDPPGGGAQYREGVGSAVPGMTIFAERDFLGLSATFRKDTPDLRKFEMNDRVDSLRTGRGELWEVCENINYKGRCRVFSGDERDLGRIRWDGIISSIRRLKEDGRSAGVPPLPARSRLVLYGETRFRGRAFALSSPDPTLHAPDNRVKSAKVYGGAWELCDASRYRGRCVTLAKDTPDLSRVGLRTTVNSARPADGRR